MEESRRTFLKILPLSLLGFGLTPSARPGAAGKDGGFEKAPGGIRGRKWAMVVDPRRCPDQCRECIEACHRTHNVPDFGNRKDEIKWIWNEPFGNAFPGQDHPFFGEGFRKRPVIVLCNHCDNPPCVRVCPTKATFRRKEDGIVMMDYHRCIGCRFCVAGCPYGARSMNFRDPRPFVKALNPDFPTRTKGVVEKCNFCEERLSKGRLPACVTACKERGLVFGDLMNPSSEVRQLLRDHFTIRRKAELGTSPQVYYIM